MIIRKSLFGLVFVLSLVLFCGHLFPDSQLLRRDFSQDDIKDAPIFRTCGDLRVWGNNIYIVDNMNDRVVQYQLNDDIEFVRTIGRKGLGPGDLTRPVRLHIENDFLIIRSRIGYSFFDKSGNYQKRFRMPSQRISFTFAGEKIYSVISNPNVSHLIEAYSSRGDVDMRFGQKHLKLNYKINPNKKMSISMIESTIYHGILLSDSDYLYYITQKFGQLLKYDFDGKLQGQKDILSLFGEISNSRAKWNRETFLEEGFDLRKNRGIPQSYVFQGARLVGNYIYFLCYFVSDKETDGKPFMEMRVVDKNCLKLQKVYTMPLKDKEHFMKFDVMLEGNEPNFIILNDEIGGDYSFTELKVNK